jgi:hypothetical protein
MLASTVQFSTYDQTPTPHHRQPRHPNRDTERYDSRSALTEGAAPGNTRATHSLRTQQRAYDPTHAPDPVPRTPRKMRSTESPPREPAELVSVPPSSTTPHTPQPSEDRTTITVQARLWTTPHEGRGQCSLERR